MYNINVVINFQKQGGKMMKYADIQSGDMVTGKNKFGEFKGRAKILGPAGWVLNCGGAPKIVGPDNFVKARKGANREPDYLGAFLNGGV